MMMMVMMMLMMSIVMIRSVIGIQGLELESVIFFPDTFRFRFLPTCTGRRIIASR